MTDKENKPDNLTAQEERLIKALREERSRVMKKFPLVFALLATFGAAVTFSGINKIIENIEFFEDNPITMIVIGLIILFITGAAYRKLG